GRKVVLSHYPMLFYNGQFNQKTYMLYGHVHDSFDEYLINKFLKVAEGEKRPARGYSEEVTTPFQIINCFCLFSDYTPLSLDEWILLDKKRRSEFKA
ncbi:MAG: phosphoesterase, partial [Candidatus Ornithospirochaeta sp.]